MMAVRAAGTETLRRRVAAVRREELPRVADRAVDIRRTFTRRVLIARVIGGSAMVVAASVNPLMPERGLISAGAAIAAITSLLVWPLWRRSWRSTAAVFVVLDLGLVTYFYAHSQLTSMDIFFIWPVLLAGFLIGPGWAPLSTLGAALGALYGDFVVRGMPLSLEGALVPVLMLMLLGYLVYRIGILQRRLSWHLSFLSRRERRMFEGAPDAIILLDDRFRIQEWNPAAARLFGWDDSIRSRDLASAGPFDPRTFAQARFILGAGMPFGPVEREHRTADGRALRISSSIAAIQAPDSAVPDGYMAIIRDISQLRRQERQFERLSDVATRIAEATEPDAVTGILLEAGRELTDADVSVLVACSDRCCDVVAASGAPGWIVGYRFGAPEHDRLLERLGLHEAVWTELPCDVPTRGYMVTGRTSETPFTPSDERVLEALAGHAAAALQKSGMLEEERRTREKLERANSLKDEFLTTVSHELRTPLTTLGGFLETLHQRGEDIDPALRRDLVQRASKQADRLSRLVLRLLSMTDCAAGYRPRIAGVDLDDVVARAAEAAQLAPVRCADLDGVTVLADADALEIVLGNLLENAAKYGDAGSVEVRATRLEGRCAIAVSDRGPGVPVEDRDRLFERFFRGSGQLSTPGLGVGLAIVRDLVGAMGGSVWYEPRSPRGSRFVVSLPLVDLSSAVHAGVERSA